MVKCARPTAQKLEEACLDLDLLSATRVTWVYLYRLSIVASTPILLLLGSFVTLWLSWLKTDPGRWNEIILWIRGVVEK